jgi:hypothetical protein
MNNIARPGPCDGTNPRYTTNVAFLSDRLSEHAASLAASLSIAPDCEYLKINPEKIDVLIIPSHATHNLNGSRTNTKPSARPPWKETRSYLPASPSPRSRLTRGSHIRLQAAREQNDVATYKFI